LKKTLTINIAKNGPIRSGKCVITNPIPFLFHLFSKKFSSISQTIQCIYAIGIQKVQFLKLLLLLLFRRIRFGSKVTNDPFICYSIRRVENIINVCYKLWYFYSCLAMIVYELHNWILKQMEYPRVRAWLTSSYCISNEIQFLNINNILKH